MGAVPSPTATAPPPPRPLSIPIPFTGVYASIAGSCLVLAWEWLVSGLNKLAAPAFLDEFGPYVSSHLRGSLPAFYVELLQWTAVSHPRTIAVLVTGLELTLGASLLAAALVLLMRPSRLVRPTLFGVLAAGFGGALLALNLAVLQGDPAPWAITGQPFQSGVPVEYLLAMVSLAAGVGAAVLLRRTRYLRRPRAARRGRAAPTLAAPQAELAKR